MVDDISCEIEPSGDPDERGELYCEVGGNRRHVSDLTKDQCTQTDYGEWVRGHPRVQNWSGVTDPRKRRILKHMLRNDKNIVQSMSQQDDPIVKPSTAEYIQESYQQVSGSCRFGRNRSESQPDSYDTGTTDTTTDTTTSEPDPEPQDPDWTNDLPSEQELLEMNQAEMDSVDDVLSGI